jgi:hypothetical protein
VSGSWTVRPVRIVENRDVNPIGELFFLKQHRPIRYNRFAGSNPRNLAWFVHFT